MTIQSLFTRFKSLHFVSEKMYGQIVIYDMKYGVGDKRGSSPLNKLKELYQMI
uniref:Uncharacterized protein n=1 Tax=virus sp. ctmTa7 TaxID=2828255 RepID=A0A8S5RBZ3_9VIRU|nr:MAG TPA: hypothetical protein [virus sp. ctmTa7]DAU18466.1 MAG TPA: hypothetical protein [Bacteriophage sp.]